MSERKQFSREGRKNHQGKATAANVDSSRRVYEIRLERFCDFCGWFRSSKKRAAIRIAALSIIEHRLTIV